MGERRDGDKGYERDKGRKEEMILSGHVLLYILHNKTVFGQVTEV
jgi:hypothetical protein